MNCKGNERNPSGNPMAALGIAIETTGFRIRINFLAVFRSGGSHNTNCAWLMWSVFTVNSHCVSLCFASLQSLYPSGHLVTSLDCSVKNVERLRRWFIRPDSTNTIRRCPTTRFQFVSVMSVPCSEARNNVKHNGLEFPR